MPQLEKKYDIYTTIRLSTPAMNAIREFHFSFSPVAHAGITVARYSKYAKSNTTLINGYASSDIDEVNCSEMMAGYYNRWSKYLSANLYMGYGRGYSHNYIQGESPTVAYYQKYFLQPCITVDKKNVRLALGTRVSLLHYNAISGYMLNGVYEDAGLQFIAGKKNHLLFEPFWMVGGGTGGFKYCLQGGSTVGPGELMPVSNLFGGLSLDVYFNPVLLFRKIRKK